MIRSRNRAGALLVETTVALILLMAAMGIAVQLIAAAGRSKRREERPARAEIEAANVMERLSTVPFDRATPEFAHQIVLSDAARQVLPGAALSIEITPQTAPEHVAARRIQLALRWKMQSGEWDRPVTLVSYRYQAENKP